MKAVVEVKTVAKEYYQANQRLPVLENVTFCAEKNEFISIIGKSGCGKTTLLKIVANLIDPSAGSVTISGSGAIGYVPQNLALVPWLSVFQNAALPLYFLSVKNRKEAEKKVEEKLKLVELWEFRNYYPRQLSGGMQQRLAIARSLVVSPKIMLMDEPFRSLDEISRFQLNQDFLAIWTRAKTTVIFVTHSIPEAVFLSTRVLLMSDRPAKIKAEFKIKISYPRNEDTLNQTYFLERVKEIKSFITR